MKRLARKHRKKINKTDKTEKIAYPFDLILQEAVSILKEDVEKKHKTK